MRRARAELRGAAQHERRQLPQLGAKANGVPGVKRYSPGSVPSTYAGSPDRELLRAVRPPGGRGSPRPRPGRRPAPGPSPSRRERRRARRRSRLRRRRRPRRCTPAARASRAGRGAGRARRAPPRRPRRPVMRAPGPRVVRVRLRAPGDRVEGVVDRDVSHRVEARLGRRGPDRRDAGATAALPAFAFQAPTGSERAPPWAPSTRPAAGGPRGGRVNGERDELHHASGSWAGAGGGT